MLAACFYFNTQFLKPITIRFNVKKILLSAHKMCACALYGLNSDYFTIQHRVRIFIT
jgi:hypothetical protein